MATQLSSVDFTKMDNATLAASLALYNRWRKGVGEFYNRPKKKLPYAQSEITALINEIVKRLES